MKWLDLFSEIASTIRRNKLRTALTGFAVAWGIFMLVILLAAGNGLNNGVNSNFEGEARNLVHIWPGLTSMKYNGQPEGKFVKLDIKDSLLLATTFSEIENVYPTISKYNVNISKGKKYSITSMTGVVPNFDKFDRIKIVQGRFINDLDNKNFRKSVVISENCSNILFGNTNTIGQEVIIDKLSFKIVGIYHDDREFQAKLYIPYSLLKSLMPDFQYREIVFSISGLNTREANKNFETKLRNKLSNLHNFNPDDNRAIWIWNQFDNYLETINVFSAINMFIWIIGLGTLIAGIVGISNIMLITVRERTKEFGIRKALGATPSSILRLIITESLIITASFGYIGMMLGVGVTEIINLFLSSSENSLAGNNMTIFKNPTVDLSVVISATLVLVLAGAIAGYIPAKKAVKIKPIEALRYE